MLAARDQENLVHTHLNAAASKPLNQGVRTLQPKTPGNKYPKTPLKVPLHDENAPTGFGGKKGKGIGALTTGGKNGAVFDKDAFVTPMGPRTRAPLGMKTTNAKAKANQTPGPEKEAEKAQQVQTSTRKPKRVTHAETTRIAVHGDESPLIEREVEYCPPTPKDLPYQSEDFPENCLNYDALKSGNLTRGSYDRHHGPLNEQRERQAQEAYVRSAKKADEQIMKMMEEEWTVGDVPETFRHLRKKGPLAPKRAQALNSVQRPALKPATKPMAKPAVVPAKASVATKGPSTISSRNAASLLSSTAQSVSAVPAKPTTLATKPKAPVSLLSRAKKADPVAQPPPSTMRSAAAAATSRSTMGYTKGRNALNALKRREPGVPMPRTVSTSSQGSESTITPEKFSAVQNERWSHLKLLGAFDIDDGNQSEGEMGLKGDGLDFLMASDDEEEYVLTLG